MEGEAEAARQPAGPPASEARSGRSQEAFKQLKVRISKEECKSPRKPVDASHHSNIGGHGGAAGWFWRNSYSGTTPHGYHPESPKLYNAFSGTDSTRCPSSPVHVPVTMAFQPAPGYVMFPVMLSGAPDSPRGGLTPLMGSPVSTPTAMMFPQTPFAQLPSAGPFAPPQGPGGPSMRPTSISGAPQVPGGPQGPDGASAFFHPLFNGFNAFGGPGVSMAPPPHGAFGGPGAPMVQVPPPPGGKQSRSSNAGDKGRPYQPSPLKPGPRKSSGNGGPPSGIGAFPPMLPLIGRNSNNNSAAVGGPGSSGSSVSPQQPSTASSSARGTSRPMNAQAYQTPGHGGYHLAHGGSGGNCIDGGVDPAADGADASPSPHQPASLSPEPSVTSYSTSAAARPPGGTSTTATSRDVLDPTTAAAAAAVVAAAAAAANMSSGPTPRTSYTGPSVTPPPRSSLSGGLGATASGRTSGSGVALPGAAANALNAATAHLSLQDDSAAPMQPSGLDTDGVGLSSGDVDLPPYGSFVAHGMAHHMGNHAAAAAAAASAASAWGFYDGSAAAAGIGNQQVWPTAAMPRLFGAAPHMIGGGIAHLSHPHSHHQVAAMAAAQQHVPQPAAAMQQPSLLHAAMLQQLAAAANVPAAMPCYVAAPSLDNDYMAAAAAAENLQAQLQGLQSIHGAIIASQNLRAAAAAVADMQQQPHHGVMAQVAANAAGLSSGGMLMNPAFLSGALGAHHQAHHHLPGGMHMHSMGMSGGLGPRQRRNHGNGVGAGAAAGAGAGTAADGQVRLNARQRRTLRRAKERAIRGLLEAGKLLVARTMGEGGAEGDEGAASGCDIPSGGYDTDDGDQSDDGESPARPACISACSVTANSGSASSPEVSGVTGVSSAASAAPSGPSAPAAKCSPPADAASPTPDPALAHHGECRSPISSNASSVCEAGSTGGRAVSNASSVGGPETLLMAAANSTPSSGKVSPLSAEGSNEPSPAPAPAAPQQRATASAAVEARVSPAPSGRSTSAGGSVVPAGSAVAAAAALASGAASDLDIAALIQQLNQKREEGLVDEKLLRDLEIINNLIGALKSSVPNTAPSYNAQGRKPSAGHPHGGHSHAHHHAHGNVNAGHALHYLNAVPKLPKGFAVGY